jgi:tetratricopeptide (TPR) repeat protein
MKNTKRDKNKKAIVLSPAKRKLFFVITVTIPFLFLICLETGLRIFNYGDNLDLFINGPDGYDNFMQLNPDIALRYFSPGSVIPNPPQQLFLKHKTSNVYRIFVLGESSVVGFPYGNNVSFPNILERALSKTFPEKRLEVISAAMPAINSYALLDQLDEIIEQSPDALLIYTGHNEYYGALGVGSAQTLGKMRWLVRAYLKLRHVKTFMLLRNGIDWIMDKLHGDRKDVPKGTLMENVVAEQTIPYGGSLYDDGKKQFEENLDIILEKATERHIPVILSELVSNLKGQGPFISVEDEKGRSANSFFTMARKAEEQGDRVKAEQSYIKAKDYDALRFRAPEEFNIIIKKLAHQYSLPLVPMVSYFEKESPDGIMGNDLFLEHLHPNHHGYYLMAKAFYETMRSNNLVTDKWHASHIEQEQHSAFTELDSVFAAINIQRLKSGWPFQSKDHPNNYIRNYKPSSLIEKTALHAAILQQYNSLEQGHMDIGDYYTQQKEFDKALAEYDAAIASIPHATPLYLRIANILYQKKEYKKAFKVLQNASYYRETSEINKWLGVMASMDKNYKEAIPFFLKADKTDPEIMYYLGTTYYFDGQMMKGDEYFSMLQRYAPRSAFLANLSKLRYSLLHTRR